MTNISTPPSLDSARVGVIGGSGLYAIDGLEDVREIELETPFGTPSDGFRVGRLNGVDIVFLARHGRHHHLLPSEVPYRANVWAMRSLGVRWLVSVSAVAFVLAYPVSHRSVCEPGVGLLPPGVEVSDLGPVHHPFRHAVAW